jgi:hypothetical protein
MHVAVKGSPDKDESVVFGLSEAEMRRVGELLRLWGHRVGQDGHQVSQNALDVVSLLTRELGYLLVATTQGPHSTVVYTLHRHYKHPDSALNRAY